MQPRSSADGIAVVLLAAGAIAGALLDGPWLWLHYLYKPMTTAMILSLAARAAPLPSIGYRRAVVAGMLFSLAGDVFLMLPQDLFVPGLVAFLLAHLCFIAAFFPGARWPARLVAIGTYAAVAGANLALLLPKVPPPLHVPVLAYGLRTDFRGELFEGSQYLLAWADSLSEIKTICHTGRKATMVVRVDEKGRAITDGPQVEIGGNERYVSVSRGEFKKIVAGEGRIELQQPQLPLAPSD